MSGMSLSQSHPSVTRSRQLTAGCTHWKATQLSRSRFVTSLGRRDTWAGWRRSAEARPATDATNGRNQYLKYSTWQYKRQMLATCDVTRQGRFIIALVCWITANIRYLFFTVIRVRHSMSVTYYVGYAVTDAAGRWRLADPADRFFFFFFFWGGGGGSNFGGADLTTPIFNFLHGFRPLYFEVAEFWWFLCLFFMFILVRPPRASSRTGGSCGRAFTDH